jgi:hypothetical protein
MKVGKKLFVLRIALGKVTCISTGITVPENLVLEEADHVLLRSSNVYIVGALNFVSVSLLTREWSDPTCRNLP